MEGEFIQRIVREAEELLSRDFAVYAKGSEGDLVTDADYLVERFLIEKIRAEYPDFAIISEEFNPDAKLSENCFIIDPIDGTKNFANGLPLWGIQVACRKNGETVASVIDLPALKEFYFADESGAYLNGEKISVREVPILNAFYAAIGGDVIEAATRMQKYGSTHRVFGAACVAFAFLAAGRMHGVSFRAENPWDFEPGLFLAKQAGAIVKSEPGFHASAMNEEFLRILEDETRR